MNSNKLLVVALVLLTTINSISSSSDFFESLSNFKKTRVGTDGLDVFQQKHEGPRRKTKSSIRVLAQKPRATMTCDRYPRVCSGVGPDCCNKQCVNVMRDRVNCGMCGKKCKYQEICCKGLCVNTAFDGKNCGNCNNRCKKGSSCLYGMCNYA